MEVGRHVERGFVLDLVVLLLARVSESLQMENKHFGQRADFFYHLGFSQLLAFLAFVFIPSTQLLRLKVLAYTLLQRIFHLQAHNTVRLVRHRLVLTSSAFHHVLADPNESRVYYRWVGFKVLLGNIHACPCTIQIAHLSIKLGSIERRCFILQGANDMHKEFMAVLLLHWVELPSHKIF